MKTCIACGHPVDFDVTETLVLRGRVKELYQRLEKAQDQIFSLESEISRYQKKGAKNK